jgi:error-prone DNA polymerase
LRRSMATFKAKGLVSNFRKKLVDGMVARGYKEEFAARVFKQLEGFGSYGFPESHAASFAHLVYISCWLKWHYPDVFAAALLNSQPMGFYHPAEIVDDARNHGVVIRPIDINHSQWDHTLEEKEGKYCALRLGFRLVKGLREEEMQLLVSGAPYTHIPQLMNAGISQSALEMLADADAFRSIGLDRRQALWEISALGDRPMALLEDLPSETAGEQITLPFMTASEHVVHDIASTSLSIKAHPVSFVRYELDQLGVVPTAKLKSMKNGDRVKVAGMITVRQRPGTAKGVVFVTIKDETGFSNVVVWGAFFDKYRKEIIQSRLLMVEGKLQVEGEVIHVVAAKCVNLNFLLKKLTEIQDEDLPPLSLARADETTMPPPEQQRGAHKREVFYKGRNFK